MLGLISDDCLLHSSGGYSCLIMIILESYLHIIMIIESLPVKSLSRVKNLTVSDSHTSLVVTVIVRLLHGRVN